MEQHKPTTNINRNSTFSKPQNYDDTNNRFQRSQTALTPTELARGRTPPKPPQQQQNDQTSLPPPRPQPPQRSSVQSPSNFATQPHPPPPGTPRVQFNTQNNLRPPPPPRPQPPAPTINSNITNLPPISRVQTTSNSRAYVPSIQHPTPTLKGNSEDRPPVTLTNAHQNYNRSALAQPPSVTPNTRGAVVNLPPISRNQSNRTSLPAERPSPPISHAPSAPRTNIGQRTNPIQPVNSYKPVSPSQPPPRPAPLKPTSSNVRASGITIGAKPTLPPRFHKALTTTLDSPPVPPLRPEKPTFTPSELPLPPVLPPTKPTPIIEEAEFNNRERSTTVAEIPSSAQLRVSQEVAANEIGRPNAHPRGSPRGSSEAIPRIKSSSMRIKPSKQAADKKKEILRFSKTMRNIGFQKEAAVMKETEKEFKSVVETEPKSLKKASYKICILGGQCGKTSYLLRFVEDKFHNEESPTVEYSFYKNVIIDDEECSLELMDTSGDDGYANLHEKWYQSAEGFIIMCNVTSRTSYQEASLFFQELQATTRPHSTPKILVATAGDRSASRNVTLKQISDLATQFDCPYFEVSAKNGDYVSDSIIALVREIRTSRDVQLFYNPTPEKKAKREELIDPMIPLFLTSRNQTVQGYSLTNSGFIISTYNLTGTTLIHRYDGKQLTYYHNESPSVCKRLRYPYLISLHKDGILQVINIENRSGCDQHQLDQHEVKDINNILFDGERVFLVSLKRVLVFDWPIRNDPLEIQLEDHKEMPMTGVVDDFCAVIAPDKILLGGPWAFQVWQLDYSLCQALLLRSITNPTKQESFLTMNYSNNVVITRKVNSTLLWKIEGGDPIEIKLDSKVVITSCFLDANFMITGDNFGETIVRTVSDGKIISKLSSVKRIDRSSDTSGDRIGLNLENRVNCIQRTGRLVWIGQENGMISVYDIYQSPSSPLADTILKGFAVKNVNVEGGLAIFQVIAKASEIKNETAKNSPKIFVWVPSIFISNDSKNTFRIPK